jgi:hypothetical protein
MTEVIETLKAYIEKRGGTFAGKKQKNELLRDLAYGTRFRLRAMTEIEDGVTMNTLIKEYDGDLRLPYKVCIFEIPYVSVEEPCVIIARQHGAGVEVTGFQLSDIRWLYTGLVAKVCCNINNPGVRTTVIKNLACYTPEKVYPWLTKMLLFALEQVHQRANNVTVDQSVPRAAAAYTPAQVPPQAVPTHSYSTVTIGGQAAGNAVGHAPRPRRKGTPKRAHERRGHWRVYKKSGRRVWINAQAVGHRSMGTVQHDYRVV